MPSVFIKTYGCQMNERDSEAVAAQLMAKGYGVAPDESQADVILLNTCSVRDSAEQKALNKMGSLAGQVRKHRPDTLLGFMGCMAQSRGQELIDQLPDVDLVLGTQKIHRAGQYLDDLFAGRRERVVDTDAEKGSEAAIREHLSETKNNSAGITAFVSIMQGCNQFCTFCIVPYTRGRERCRSIEDIVAECRGLVDDGVKEVTLLGQIVNSYGKREIGSKDGKSAFVQLIEAVHEINGLERIRFTSPHPKGYGEDLVESYGRLPKLVENAHLPVQSGSDRMLKLMHRGYTRDRFVELVNKLRAVRPGIGVGTDIIVGFPGETEEDFEHTLSLCKQVKFDNAFLFKYSKRRDTPAASMPDQLPEELIEERHAHLMEVTDEIRQRKLQDYVGRRMEVLVEGYSRRNTERLEGRTRCNKIVIFEGGDRFIGQVLEVEIESATKTTLYGNPAIINLN
ncbi:MAG TPA: tRNA (N6-isopentenyl adenosine(37)-C2)-methylthiotransferase MiaB [Verrucomicrobiales bacterium]|nr:tRNA (N6-isopentenyl adenosine(37)-C2)-methylthiotransferase MiaB [Verrucomicrobiales bacterium]